MKEHRIEVSVRLMATDTADACERIAAHFHSLAAVYRGDAKADAIDISTWAPRSTLSVRPVHAGDMN